MQKRGLVLTAGIAWLGGLLTAFLGASCDPGPTDPDPETEPSLQTMAGMADTMIGEFPQQCRDEMAQPSTYVAVMKRSQDYYRTIAPDRVWFSHDGKEQEAQCVLAKDGECTGFVAGYELTGEITVYAEWCDTVVSETVFVERPADSCHVELQRVMIEASSRGCLASQPEPDPGDPHPPRLK